MSLNVRPAEKSSATKMLSDELESELRTRSVVQSIRGMDNAAKYLRDCESISVSKYAIAEAVSNGSLEYVSRSQAYYFSPRALLRWWFSGVVQS